MTLIEKPSDLKPEEGQLEVRIVPLNDFFVVQVSSEFIRGTLMIDNSLEVSDVKDIMEEIYNFIDRIMMTPSDTGENEVGN